MRGQELRSTDSKPFNFNPSYNFITDQTQYLATVQVAYASSAIHVGCLSDPGRAPDPSAAAGKTGSAAYE